MMWAMEESNEIKNQILYYKSGKFEEIKHAKDDTCEGFCKELCRRWSLPPLVQLLFGLRVHGTKIWLASSRQLVADKQYEFRIRIKIPKLADLNKHDKNTFDYFYHQVRYDVLHNDIPGLINEKTRNKILGLCVTDMYVEMLENENKEYRDDRSRLKAREDKIKYLSVNYKNYIPKILYEKHWVILQMRIKKSLKGVDYKHDPLYVKTSYIQQVDSMAPNYLIEEYWGTISYPQEDQLRKGTCRVRLQIAPYDKEQPGLRMHYAYKDTWRHISTFNDFYAIQIDKQLNQVRLEIQNSPQGFPVTMENIDEIESFVNCMNIYYRLTVKWTWYLCELQSLWSPSLDFLNEKKIHGPVGGGYSYNKIKEHGKGVGTYVIRQCEKEFDIYYIDILTKKNQSCETFKIDGTSDKWQLYDNESNTVSAEFSDLVSLAKSIPIESVDYNRLPPSRYEKPQLLLLCQTNFKSVPNAAAVNSTTLVATPNSPGLRTQRPTVFTNEDFRMYITSTRDINDGAFDQRKAEYRDRNTEVTLKILKTHEKLTEFHMLADKWSKLDISEIVKLNGIMLYNPVALVLEPLKYGPLDIFLRTHEFRKQVVPLNLVETAYSLARALHYLQEKQIAHGRIRCASLEVIQFDPGNSFEVKLGDPGLPRDCTIHDVPWIPIEDYEDLDSSRKNLKADIWAYATTLWEIFSRGASPFTVNMQNPMDFFQRGDRLPKPKECESLRGIYEIMKSGWDETPEKRFAPQTIFSPLLEIKTLLSRHYETPSSLNRINGTVAKVNGNVRNGTTRSSASMIYNNGSMISNETERTYVSSSLPGTLQPRAHTDGGSSIGGSSEVSLLNGHSIASNGSHSTTNAFADHKFDGECMELDENTKLSFRGFIGSGNFGNVYKGTKGPLIFNHMDDEEEEVAIKCFKPIDSINQSRDFLREARMMKGLNHENIVKIYDFHEDMLLIIMEYMSGGSLQEFVAIHRHELTVDDILQFAMHIAKGMHYLELKNIVHRDLAARNVLVTRNSSLLLSDTICKIADFGLAQFTNHYGYYESTNNRDLPLQWYAPETISCMKFSSKSDVWSYGVTLFEMFSFGETPKLIPKSEFKGEDLLLALQEGKRLKCPKHCPKHIYEDLMSVCWNYKTDLRPNFAEIIDKIRNFLIRNGEIV